MNGRGHEAGGAGRRAAAVVQVCRPDEPQPAAAYRGVLPRVLLAGALVAILAGFLVRLPALAHPIGIDQGIFAAAGLGLREGLQLYTELWDQKPPAIHLTYAAAIAVFGAVDSAVFWIDFAASVLTCVLVWLIARRTANPTIALAAACMFALLTVPAARYGYGGFLERAVPESFIVVLASAAALCATGSGSARAGVLAGLLVGAAAVYKPTALIYWPVLVLWRHLSSHPTRRFALWSGLALPLPALVTTLWLLAAGGLSEAWIAVVEYNRTYVQTGSGAFVLLQRVAHEVWRWMKTDPLWLLGSAAMLTALFAAAGRRRLPAPAPLLAMCWLAAVIIAAAANGVRLYATYFIPASAPLAIAAGWLIGTALREPRRLLSAVALLAVAAAAIVGWRSHQPGRVWATTRADLHAMRAGGDHRLAYLERFGGYNTGRGYSARANAELAGYIASHTRPADRVYVFGMAPSVYFMARRLPANRFLWTYPGVTNLVQRDEFTVDAMAHQLAEAAPALLVLERNNRDSLTGWRIEHDFESAPMRALLVRYVREVEIEDFVVYRLSPAAR